MLLFSPAQFCRISGEPLEGAQTLFELEACPLPGVYPEHPEESVGMESPLKVVQARFSGHVQLAHITDSKIYDQYAFAGGGSQTYRSHLAGLAGRVSSRFASDAAVMEVGCGDGWLLRELHRLGYRDLFGIDPSRASSADPFERVEVGYFPDDLPPEVRHRQFDLVICRHVLEHIEAPGPFVRNLAVAIKDTGEVWIEVPDLRSTIDRGLWGNFYQLHCNYFCDQTLDAVAAQSNLRCLGGEWVDVFGGSLLRRYGKGTSASLNAPIPLTGVGEAVAHFRRELAALAESLPPGAVGYGAAERTAAMVGLAPEFKSRLSALYDGNHLLHGRYLAGTQLQILPKERLTDHPPPAIVLFAISNAAEILAEWKARLPHSTEVCIARAGFPRGRLGDLSAT